ncbi:hypothetical protein HK44_000005 [Pseudomonas fluorescens HK44]|uniref:Uncharacterized protein n=1 Tax=Pseudomonas fluorescens HK44 TaxID=1042209 RepID=A0A010T1A2_PSEFL|nr:hypothetical protein HK44_000005 [Pseudomonas fluorescens HK44]
MIGGQQCNRKSITPALLLRQQLITMLDDRATYLALYLGSQEVFAVVTLTLQSSSDHATNKPVESVIAIMAYRFRLDCHGMSASKILCAGVQY